MNSFRRAIYFTDLVKLPREAKVQIWQTIFWAKASYGNVLLSLNNPQIERQLQSHIFQSLKIIFDIKANPKMEDLTHVILGTSAHEYINTKAKIIDH